jgi:hypothetical protein
MRIVILAAFALSLSGCATIQRIFPGIAPEPAAQPAAAVAPAEVPAAPLTALAPIAPAGAQTAAALDQSTPEQVAAATAPVATGARELGQTVVALGSPAEQGFWIRTTLVTVPGTGRVVTEGGQSVNVDLQPGSGGSLLSLAAFRQLGLGLTDLPEVTVFAD